MRVCGTARLDSKRCHGIAMRVAVSSRSGAYRSSKGSSTPTGGQMRTPARTTSSPKEWSTRLLVTLHRAEEEHRSMSRLGIGAARRKAHRTTQCRESMSWRVRGLVSTGLGPFGLGVERGRERRAAASGERALAQGGVLRVVDGLEPRQDRESGLGPLSRQIYRDEHRGPDVNLTIRIPLVWRTQFGYPWAALVVRNKQASPTPLYPRPARCRGMMRRVLSSGTSCCRAYGLYSHSA